MDEDTVAQHILDACGDCMVPGQVAPELWYRRAAKAIVRDHRRSVWTHIIVCNGTFVIVSLLLAKWFGG